MTGGIQLIDAFRYSGKRFLDLRQHCATLAELVATAETSIPDGFTKYCEETRCWYEWNSHNDDTPTTGRWRKRVPVDEVLSEEYIFAIVDEKDTFLFGIRHNGEVVYNKGMSDEVRARFKQLEGIQPMSNENFIYAITDANGVVLFGITRKGEVVYNKGMSDEVRERLAELKGIKTLKSDNWLFALTDANDRLLAGIRPDGTFVVPRGIIEIVTWEEYERRPQDDNVLYLIEGEGGSLTGAYYKGRVLNTGEEYNFLREDNLLLYRGKMSVMPRIGINHRDMTLEVDYPSDYQGPFFENVDGLLVLK